MTGQDTNMNKLDYGSSFGFFFKEEGWFKTLVLASLLTCTLVGAAPVMGWTVAIVRRIARGEEPPVPPFTDWKAHWLLGGQFAFVNVVWLLPLLAAVIVLYIPLNFTERLGNALLPVLGGTLLCVLGFLLIYSTVYIFLVPSMMIVLAETGSTRKAANPVRLWRVARKNISGHLIVFLIVGLGLFNVILFLAPLTLFLALPPMLVYAGLVTGHFAGQLGRGEAIQPE
jgi:hypothetical protein